MSKTAASPIQESSLAYDLGIEKNAEKFGYKAANLMHLQKLVEEFNQTLPEGPGGIKAAVPAFSAIDSADIQGHLGTEKLVEITGLWGQFTALQQGKTSLEDPSKSILANIRNIIEQSFSDKPLALPQEEESKLIANKFMARSTGFYEDKVDIANPGGNESLPTDIRNLSSSIGAVVASYFSEKSISQTAVLNSKFSIVLSCLFLCFCPDS